MAERLNILYMTHYFPPEVNAPAVRVSEMAERWQSKDCDVTILTGFPNHPTGIIPDEYTGMKRLVTKWKNINLIRTYLYAAPNKGFAKRILNYLSFMFSSIFLGTSKVGQPDIIIGTSPQFFVAVAAYIISRIKGAKFVFEIRDVWPEEIVAVGAIKNRFIIGFLEMIEMYLYRKADLLVAVAQGTIDILTARGVAEDKMILIPNGVNISHFEKASEGVQIREKLGLTDKFVVSYIGTHGMAHRLDTVLDAAKKLKQHKDIYFLFVGDGAEKRKLMAYAEEVKLKNVIFHHQVSREEICGFYHATDLFLVPLRKAELFTKNIPSKIYEIMAAKKPILIATEGESRKMVESSGAGIGCTPEDADEMAEKILYLKENEMLRLKMGSEGFAFALANASRLTLADRYLDYLKQVNKDGKVIKKVVDTHKAVIAQDTEIKATA